MKLTFHRAALAVLLLAGLTSGVAQAQNEGKKELVLKLLQLQRPGIEAMARTLAEQPAAQAVQNSRQILQSRVPPEKREAASRAAEAEIKKYLDETVPLVRDRAIALAPTAIGPTLEEKFSEEELRQLITWIESPLNRKYQGLGTELQTTLGQKLVADMRATVEQRVRVLDTNLAKALNINQPAPAARPAASGPAKGSN